MEQKVTGDPIEKNMEARIKAGSNTSVVLSKEKKEESVFKLKLTNELPKPAEIRRDPSMKVPKEVL